MTSVLTDCALYTASAKVSDVQGTALGSTTECWSLKSWSALTLTGVIGIVPGTQQQWLTAITTASQQT